MPKPLFVLPPTISATDYLTPDAAQKTAGVRLVSPPGAWSDEILQTLLRDHPYLPHDRLVVNFKQRDDAMGYGVGYVSIIDSPRVSIPVVITARELKPMDIMIVRSPQQAGEVGTQEGAGSTSDDRVLPLTEQNFDQAADASGIGEVVLPSDIRGSQFTEDGSAMRLPMRSDPSITAGFHVHGIGEIVNAWFAAPEPGRKIAAKLASLPVEISYAKTLDTLPTALETTKISAATIFLADGTAKTAMAFSAIDLANPTVGAQDWFAFEDGTYCKAAAQVVGVPQDPSAVAAVVAKLAATSLRRGADIVFCVNDAITAPLKVASIQVDEAAGSYHVALTTSLGAPVQVLLAKGVKQAAFDDTTGSWLFPLDAKVLQLSGYASEYQQPASAGKVASILDKQLPDQLIVANGQWSMTGSGTPFFTNASKTAAAETLARWFANSDDLMAQAEAKGHLRFDGGLDKTAASLEAQKKTAAAIPGMVKKALADFGMPLAAAAKLAAAIGRPDCADAVLSTGFLNEDNLADFMQLEGTFEQTVEGLARLLLAIRMGLPGDENATAVAMKSLQRVTERLQSANQEVSQAGY
jgi:hypothetical protein